MIVNETAHFKRIVKKLHKNQKSDLDKAIKNIMSNPNIGDAKKGDILGIQVYKFKMVKQETLLAYIFDGHTVILTLLLLGDHENFYDKLKRQINK